MILRENNRAQSRIIVEQITDKEGATTFDLSARRWSVRLTEGDLGSLAESVLPSRLRDSLRRGAFSEGFVPVLCYVAHDRVLFGYPHPKEGVTGSSYQIVSLSPTGELSKLGLLADPPASVCVQEGVDIVTIGSESGAFLVLSLREPEKSWSGELLSRNSFVLGISESGHPLYWRRFPEEGLFEVTPTGFREVSKRYLGFFSESTGRDLALFYDGQAFSLKSRKDGIDSGELVRRQVKP